MRITKRTNIAMRLLMYCAANPDALVTKKEIASCCNVSENHLAQVVNQLSQLGFLATQRGRNGGIMLGRPAEEIRVGQVFRSVEGDAPPDMCLADSDQTCPLVGACRLRGALEEAMQAFFTHLDDTSLSELVCGNVALLDMLQNPCPSRPIPEPA